MQNSNNSISESFNNIRYISPVNDDNIFRFPGSAEFKKAIRAQELAKSLLTVTESRLDAETQAMLKEMREGADVDIFTVHGKRHCNRETQTERYIEIDDMVYIEKTISDEYEFVKRLSQIQLLSEIREKKMNSRKIIIADEIALQRQLKARLECIRKECSNQLLNTIKDIFETHEYQNTQIIEATNMELRLEIEPLEMAQRSAFGIYQTTLSEYEKIKFITMQYFSLLKKHGLLTAFEMSITDNEKIKTADVINKFQHILNDKDAELNELKARLAKFEEDLDTVNVAISNLERKDDAKLETFAYISDPDVGGSTLSSGFLTLERIQDIQKQKDIDQKQKLELEFKDKIEQVKQAYDATLAELKKDRMKIQKFWDLKMSSLKKSKNDSNSKKLIQLQTKLMNIAALSMKPIQKHDKEIEVYTSGVKFKDLENADLDLESIHSKIQEPEPETIIRQTSNPELESGSSLESQEENYFESIGAALEQQNIDLESSENEHSSMHIPDDDLITSFGLENPQISTIQSSQSTIESSQNLFQNNEKSNHVDIIENTFPNSIDDQSTGMHSTVDESITIELKENKKSEINQNNSVNGEHAHALNVPQHRPRKLSPNNNSNSSTGIKIALLSSEIIEPSSPCGRKDFSTADNYYYRRHSGILEGITLPAKPQQKRLDISGSGYRSRKPQLSREKVLEPKPHKTMNSKDIDKIDPHKKLIVSYESINVPPNTKNVSMEDINKNQDQKH